MQLDTPDRGGTFPRFSLTTPRSLDFPPMPESSCRRGRDYRSSGVRTLAQASGRTNLFARRGTVVGSEDIGIIDLHLLPDHRGRTQGQRRSRRRTHNGVLRHPNAEPGHLLVVPRHHQPSLAELDPRDGAQLFHVGQLAAAALRQSVLRCEGVNFFLADGAAAGQDVFHLHLHVFARSADDGFGLRLPPGYAIRPREELDAAATARYGKRGRARDIPEL